MFALEKRQLKRIGVATILSLSLFGLSCLYYILTEKALTTNADQLALGFVKSVDGSHYYKKKNSFFWDLLQEGDPFYTSQLIQTGDNGDLRLELSDRQSWLEVEAQSSIEIEEIDAQTISLKIIEGALEIHPKEKRILIDNQPEPMLISEDMVVFRDQSSQIKSIVLKDRKQISPQGIELLSFSELTPLLMNPEDPHPQSVQWAPATEDFDVFIEYGPTRKNLDHRQVFKGTAVKSDLLFPLGKHFYRWGLQKGENVEWSSQTRKLVVNPQFPPALISPASEQSLRLSLNAKNETVNFKWSLDSRFDSYELEVYEDSKAAKLLQKENFTTQDSWSWQPPRLGTFFWRMSGLNSKNKLDLRTKIQSFRVLPKDFEKVNLTWNTAGESKQMTSQQKITARLSWAASPANAAKSYRVKFAFDGETWERQAPQIFKNSPVELNLPKAGRLRVLVEALNADLDTLGVSPELKFEVMVATPLRAPALAQSEKDILKSNGRGQIVLGWAAIEGSESYELEIRSQDGRLISQTSKRNEVQLNKLMPGTYEYRVWAIDSYGQAGERSGVRQFTVPEKGSLKSPKIKKVEVQ